MDWKLDSVWLAMVCNRPWVHSVGSQNSFQFPSPGTFNMRYNYGCFCPAILFTAFCQAITVYSFQSLNRDERSIIRSDGVSPKPIDRRETSRPGNQAISAHQFYLRRSTSCLATFKQLLIFRAFLISLAATLCSLRLLPAGQRTFPNESESIERVQIVLYSCLFNKCQWQLVILQQVN